MDLWSGVIGAALSAVLAALVAVLVVWRTNKHQSKLAATALRRQAKSAKKALKSQRRLLQEQLDEQRRSELNNRALEAIVAIVELSNELLSRPKTRTVDDIWNFASPLRTGVTTLKIIGKEYDSLADALWMYPVTASGIGAYCVDSGKPEAKAVTDEAAIVLYKLVQNVTVTLSAWLQGSESERSKAISDMKRDLATAERYRLKLINQFS